jgi:hypothetical protein
MNFAESIKAFVGRRILEKKIRSHLHNPIVCNIRGARNIGIIYNATEYISFEIIKDFTRRLAKGDTKVTILGYVNSKKLIDHYLYRKGYDFFSRNDLNWFYKPVSEVTESFMQQPFDILFNLSLEEYFPIQYIVALSLSSFKVGKYSSAEKNLDLMIDIENEKALMKKLHDEIVLDSKEEITNSDIERDIEKKTQTELQLGFLINQLMHYLSLLKK